MHVRSLSEENSCRPGTTSNDNDSEVAKRLAMEGANLVFLDVPIGTEFGIDLNVFRVGDKFKGVKMIPPGLHFIFYSAVNRDDQAAPRTGFFHYFKSGELLVKKWDKNTEDICNQDVSLEEIDRLRNNLRGDLDRFLGVYPYETWKKWISLSNHISEVVMEKLEPECKKISSVTPLISLHYPPDQEMETDVAIKKPKNMEDALLPKMTPIPGSEIRFSNIPDRIFPEGSTPAEISHFCMDATYCLEKVMNSYLQSSDLLGELQVSFVCFLVGQVYDAFEQWKKLVNLFTSCDEALVKYSDFYMDLIAVLHFQLKEVPSDFFVDIVSSDNFLTVTLQRFFRYLDESSANENLKKRGQKFKQNLQKLFKWNFDFDPSDEAPVVVEIPQQRLPVIEECEQ